MPDLRVIEGGRGEVPRVVSLAERHEQATRALEAYIETAREHLPWTVRPDFAHQGEVVLRELSALQELLPEDSP
jgi:hypothetical protein